MSCVGCACVCVSVCWSALSSSLKKFVAAVVRLVLQPSRMFPLPPASPAALRAAAVRVRTEKLAPSKQRLCKRRQLLSLRQPSLLPKLLRPQQLLLFVPMARVPPLLRVQPARNEVVLGCFRGLVDEPDLPAAPVVVAGSSRLLFKLNPCYSAGVFSWSNHGQTREAYR